jgi:hypothetical protein
VEKSRHKLVKVRPTARAFQLQSKVDSFLSGSSNPTNATTSAEKNTTISLLRHEAKVQTGRLKVNHTMKKPSFGDAVAFASVTKKGMAHKRKLMGGTIQHLQNGKRMKVPSAVSSTSGTTKACPSRQFASTFKTSKK